MGNSPHIHAMCSIKWDALNESQCRKLNDFVRASISYVVRVDKIDYLIEKGIFQNYVNIFDIQDKVIIVLPHTYNPRCLRRISDGNGPECFVCRKPNNLKLSQDSTKHTFFLYLQISHWIVEND